MYFGLLVLNKIACKGEVDATTPAINLMVADLLFICTHARMPTHNSLRLCETTPRHAVL
jgi:hypothetical protein